MGRGDDGGRGVEHLRQLLHGRRVPDRRQLGLFAIILGQGIEIRAGERFAVRNSGASAVVEGVGEHLCEYMTGGTVVVLGPTGFNIGAGMSGGECFVYDETSTTLGRVNAQLVEARRPDGMHLERLHNLISTHAEVTDSPVARRIADDWSNASQAFWRVAPRGEMSKVESAEEGTVRSLV